MRDFTRLPLIARTRTVRFWAGEILLSLAASIAVAGDQATVFFEKPRAFRELTRVEFRQAVDETFLSDSEIVVGLVRGDQQRAYPLRVLGEHQIVNDTFAGPVVVTWDADSSSARAYIAEQDSRSLTFRFQGWHLGVMVLHDAETGSLWSHLTGYSLGGPLRGHRLEPLPVVMTTWNVWKHRYPDCQLPGFDYRDTYKTTFPVTSLKLSPEATRSLARPDERLPAAVRILGITHGGRSKAYRLDQLNGLKLDRLGDREVAIFHDVTGETAVFEPRIDGQMLTLHSESIDGVTRLMGSDGSVVDLSGRVLDGPLTGRQLPPVNAIESKWYAWAAYHPETLVDGVASNAQGVYQPVLLPLPRPAVVRERPRTKPTRKERREQRRKGGVER